MSNYTVINHDWEQTVNGFDQRSAAEDKRKAALSGFDISPDDLEVVQGDYETYEDYEGDDANGDVDPEIVDHSEEQSTAAVQGDPGTPAAKQAAPDTSDDDDPVMLANPIDYLRGINSEFVNTIKGTPAISKRGFRYMQTELGISTTSEVVTVIDEPKGVIVHARAETPDGRHAEAHGEGYLAEGDVKDNEFVRYADTRAKNRAISDLTSSGALSESEL